MGVSGCGPPVGRDRQTAIDGVEERFESGDLSGARERAKEALRRVDAKDPAAGVLRTELGRIYLYQGHSSEALKELSGEPATMLPVEWRIRRLAVLALTMARTGDAAGADREIEKAERIAALAGGAAMDAEVASVQGDLLLEHGRLQEAEGMFRRAVEDARRSRRPFSEAEALLNIGVVALQQERYEDALHQFETAARTAHAIGAGLELEKITGNEGFALYGLGDFSGARERFKEAQGQAEALGAPIDRIEWLNNEGLSDFRLGDETAARSAYERSLQEAEVIGMQEEIADAHAALGLLLMKTDLSSAAQHVTEFRRIAELRRNRQSGVNADLLQAMLFARTGETERARVRLEALDAKKDLPPSLHWQTEQELARVSLRMGKEGPAERWFRRAIETFHRQRLSLEEVESTLPFLENGTDLYSDYVQFLVDRGRTEEALMVVDQSRAEALRGVPGGVSAVEAGGGRELPAAGRQRLAGSLGGAILVYYVLPRESYLWVTTAERSAFFRVAGGAEIGPLMEAHRRAILEAKDLLADGQRTGKVLFERLVGPAEGMLRPEERVFLVGDGVLNELNFETLVSSKGTPHFWIEDVVLTHVPSLRLMRRSTGTATGVGGKMLLMGDPQYRTEEYRALPKAAEEVRDVMQHFRPESRTVLTGGEATPAAYRREPLGEFRYIHFVAHSTANTLKPLDSAVILSRDGDGTDKLYAREIVADRLQAELVTISGCYSSGSRVYAGEGAVGLAWAFERAGARNVIGTLWEVNDASTPALMDRMYGGLLAGVPPDAALRSAKMSLLHSTGVFRKPLYWAPFQLYSSS